MHQRRKKDKNQVDINDHGGILKESKLLPFINSEKNEINRHLYVHFPIFLCSIILITIGVHGNVWFGVQLTSFALFFFGTFTVASGQRSVYWVLPMLFRIAFTEMPILIITAHLPITYLCWRNRISSTSKWSEAMGIGSIGMSIYLLMYWKWRIRAMREGGIFVTKKSGVSTIPATKLHPWPLVSSSSRGLFPFWIRYAFTPFISLKTTWPNVKVQRSIKYSGRRSLDIYTPVKSILDKNTRLPVVLYFHPGAWVTGSKSVNSTPLYYHIASRGEVLVVAASYPLSNQRDQAIWPEHLNGAGEALVWVSENIANYNGDPSRITIGGGSAGAHISSLLALNPPESLKYPIRGVFGLYGSYDWSSWSTPMNPNLRDVLQNSVLRQKLEDIQGVLARATPMRYLGQNPEFKSTLKLPSPSPPVEKWCQGTLPWLIVHGSCDELVPVKIARDFADCLDDDHRTTVTYVEIPTMGHNADYFFCPSASTLAHTVEIWLRLLNRPKNPTTRYLAPPESNS